MAGAPGRFVDRRSRLRQTLGYIKMLTTFLGPVGAARYARAAARRQPKSADPLTMEVTHPSLAHPVALRVGTSDLYAYGQVVTRQEYGALNPRAPKVIVDCGANAGYTSAYFLNRYKDATVVAIEPFRPNAVLCRRNLAPYGDRATVLEAALWSKPTRLAVDYQEGDEWGVSVRPARMGEAGEIDGIDIPSLGLPVIDILKIDIEGSEEILFGPDAATWLPSVRNIAIELHGPACESAFRRAMAAFEFDECESGELVICSNIRLRAAVPVPA